MLKRKHTKKQDLAAAMPPGQLIKRIKKTPAAPYKNFFWPTIPQRQAPSNKPQAASFKQQALDKLVL
jgi:hypothetical protein